MPDNYKEVEIYIQNAINAMKREKKPKITTYARRFNVHYQRLQKW
jgi:hypothetical protein